MKIAFAIGYSYLVQESMFVKKKNETSEQRLAFHQVECGPPGSKPFVGCVCWFSAPRGFSPATPVSPSHQKLVFFNLS